MRKNKWLNLLPNVITYSRIVLVFISIILCSVLFIRNSGLANNIIFSYDNLTINLKIWITLFVIFFVAALTDFFDGYIARKWKITTKTGEVIDSIADKMLTITFLIVLSVFQIIFLWLTLLLIMRDIIISSIRIIHSKKNGIIKAKWHGKLKTVFLFIGILFAGFFSPLFSIVLSENVKNLQIFVNSSILMVALVLSFYSLFKYVFGIHVVNKKTDFDH